jgi:nucleotide-binding universal stress UspA family protein
MYRSILVPLDGSPFAEHALPLALNIARLAEARLEVVQVHAPPAQAYAEFPQGLDGTLAAHLRRRDNAYLDGVMSRLRSSAAVPVTASLLDAPVSGPVSDALHEHVVAAGADLVVMCTHGRGLLARAWLGSVAHHLVRALSVPVLLVRPRQGTFDLAGELGRDASVQEVLIALDGSGFAEDIIEPAVQLGRLMGARFTLLDITDPFPAVRYEAAAAALTATSYPLLEQVPGYWPERAEAHAYLERVAERLRARSLWVRTRVAAGAQPAVAILEEARQHAGLIALATHARRGLPRLFLGSVAEEVVRGASVPVLLHHGAEP